MEGGIGVCDVQFSFLMLNWIATLKSSPDKHKPFTSTISLRDSITLTTECRPTERLALRISGIGTSETYSSLRELLLRLLLKSGTAFYIMSRTTFKSGTAIAVSAE